MSELNRGVRGTQEELVTEKNVARALGSGGLAVYSTPSMITLMEYTALESVTPFLPEGSSTVGTRIDIKHLAATPIGIAIVHIVSKPRAPLGEDLIGVPIGSLHGLEHLIDEGCRNEL